MKIQAFLKESPITSVITAGRTFERKVNFIFNEKQLNFTNALVLVSILLEEPQKVRLGQLAEVLSMTKGNLSHSISSLEALGYLTRKIDLEDARVHHLTLKPSGKKAAMQAVRVLHRMQAHLEQSVGTSQIHTLLRSLKQVEASLSDAQETP
jgi:DNA-binding MarR family transcriptional regulator